MKKPNALLLAIAATCCLSPVYAQDADTSTSAQPQNPSTTTPAPDPQLLEAAQKLLGGQGATPEALQKAIENMGGVPGALPNNAGSPAPAPDQGLQHNPATPSSPPETGITAPLTPQTPGATKAPPASSGSSQFDWGTWGTIGGGTEIKPPAEKRPPVSATKTTPARPQGVLKGLGGGLGTPGVLKGLGSPAASTSGGVMKGLGGAIGSGKAPAATAPSRQKQTTTPTTSKSVSTQQPTQPVKSDTGDMIWNGSSRIK